MCQVELGLGPGVRLQHLMWQILATCAHRWQDGLQGCLPPKHSVLAVQVGLPAVGDEELGGVAVWTTVGHGEYPSPGVLQRVAVGANSPPLLPTVMSKTPYLERVVELILKLAPPDALPPLPCSCVVQHTHMYMPPALTTPTITLFTCGVSCLHHEPFDVTVWGGKYSTIECWGSEQASASTDAPVEHTVGVVPTCTQSQKVLQNMY